MTAMRGNTIRFLLSVFVLASGIVSAQDYPTRPLRLIVPYAAGGGLDINARLVAPRLADALGQPVTVENRPGGGTLIGVRAVLQAPPDGYTIIQQANSFLLNTLADKSLGVGMSDFVVLHPVTAGQFILSVHDSVPAKNLAELVAHAKANPGKLTSASIGASGFGASELSFARFKAAAGFDTLTVNYSGSAPASQAITGGVVDMFLDGAITAIQAAQSSRTRMLAVTGTRRHRLAPEVPTFVELGYPMMAPAISWTALFASVKTPAPIVQRLRSALVKVINAPDLQERFAALGYARTVPVEEFPAFLERDMLLWEQDIRRAGPAPK